MIVSPEEPCPAQLDLLNERDCCHKLCLFQRVLGVVGVVGVAGESKSVHAVICLLGMEEFCPLHVGWHKHIRAVDSKELTLSRHPREGKGH
jgi:hypothetical protein